MLFWCLKAEKGGFTPALEEWYLQKSRALLTSRTGRQDFSSTAPVKSEREGDQERIREGLVRRKLILDLGFHLPWPLAVPEQGLRCEERGVKHVRRLHLQVWFLDNDEKIRMEMMNSMGIESGIFQLWPLVKLMMDVCYDKVCHQKLIFCLLQVLSPQTRVKLLLCLRTDFLEEVVGESGNRDGQRCKKAMLAICDFREATLALQLTSWLGSSSSLAEAGSAPLENTMCVSRSKATWPFGCESFEEKKRLMKSEEQGQYYYFINWYFPHWQFHVGESFWAPGDVHRPQPGHRQSGRCCSQWKDPRCDQWETPHTWRNVQDVLGQDNWTSKASKDGLSFKKCANVGMKTDLLRPDWAA